MVKEKNTMGMAATIKQILKDQKVSQIELANRVGCSKQTVYNVMHQDSMSLQTLEKYVEALGCEILIRDKDTGKFY